MRTSKRQSPWSGYDSQAGRIADVRTKTHTVHVPVAACMQTVYSICRASPNLLTKNTSLLLKSVHVYPRPSPLMQIVYSLGPHRAFSRMPSSFSNSICGHTRVAREAMYVHWSCLYIQYTICRDMCPGSREGRKLACVDKVHSPQSLRCTPLTITCLDNPYPRCVRVKSLAALGIHAHRA